jgi:anthranilate synthase component 1
LAEDLRLFQELQKDDKEIAEHIMLVDLGRNDLGRCCQFGTVKVSELMAVEKYSHVMHLTSQVEGELDSDNDQFDLFRACFPAGTVTGAPKVKAMELIEKLEKEKRGPYAGAVGYFSLSGEMDFCIAIRTIILKDRHYLLQAGAGIVYDSLPEREFRESLDKAAALKRAIQIAREGL